MTLEETRRARPIRFDAYVLLVLLAGVLGLLSRLVRANSFAFYEDDFFYYAQPARNWVLHGISSFDGIHLTNGYHPLWFLVIAFLYRVVAPTAFLAAVQVASLGLLVCLYLAARSCLRRMGTATRLQRPAALLVTLQALLLFRYGMEINLALPLGMAMLAYVTSPRFSWTARQTLTYGLLAALTVLARLDGILLVLLLLTAQLATAAVPLRERGRRLLFFGIGFLPFAAYLLINHHYFHTLMPVSGSAKQLKSFFSPSLAPITSLFQPINRFKVCFLLPALLALAAGTLRLSGSRKAHLSPQRAIFYALLVFPVAQIATLSLISDWIVWPWYYYSFCYSTLAACALYLSEGPSPRLLYARPRWIVAALSLFYLVYVAVYSVWKAPDAIAMLGGRVGQYAHDHPGVYAIGDEAGAPAWFSGQPVIQLEGLMMDAEYLHLLKTRPPLAEVLRRYGARYYVTLQATSFAPADHCYTVEEPPQAGERSVHMEGRVCAAPLYKTDDGLGLTAYIFNAADVR